MQEVKPTAWIRMPLDEKPATSAHYVIDPAAIDLGETAPARELVLTAEQMLQLQLAEKYSQGPEYLQQLAQQALEFDATERALISRGLELALLGERLQQRPARAPRLSRRQRREIERIQRRAAKRTKRTSS